MKDKFFIISFVILSLTIISSFIGCEYDVSGSMWEKPFTAPPTPTISQVTPAQAVAGVNTITITGTNFGDPAKDSLTVYFDAVTADVISGTATSITVRRPNLVSDTCTIKVVGSSALVVAKYSPYKIESVVEQYGSFLEGLQLSVLAVDSAENLYVTEFVSKSIVKVTPDGARSVVGTINRTATEARIGPNNKLYLLGNNRAIDQVDLTTGQISRWTQLPSGKVVKFGDFDETKHLYAAGTKTDIVVVNPDLTTKATQGFYANDEVLAVRVYNNYLYVASKLAATENTPQIWKHKLDANGTLGAQELVVDSTTISKYTSAAIKGITFSASGTMYISVDDENPILIFDQSKGTMDILYKEIIPSYCKYFYWGTGNYLYLITGDTTLGAEWTVYKINIGSSGAPYFR
ncbi:MAG: hypothetical protein C4539_16305 [Ignavibacteriales bacterium]|nr:MAG: hypothetical protein C4539_16305 [Ignavibacteriales bacterium]